MCLLLISLSPSRITPPRPLPMHLSHIFVSLPVPSSSRLSHSSNSVTVFSPPLCYLGVWKHGRQRFDGRLSEEGWGGGGFGAVVVALAQCSHVSFVFRTESINTVVCATIVPRRLDGKQTTSWRMCTNDTTVTEYISV